MIGSMLSFHVCVCACVRAYVHMCECVHVCIREQAHSYAYSWRPEAISRYAVYHFGRHVHVCMRENLCPGLGFVVVIKHPDL